jgi:hypothetical protein
MFDFTDVGRYSIVHIYYTPTAGNSQKLVAKQAEYSVSAEGTDHKVHINIYTLSTTVSVPSSELGPQPPLPQVSVTPHPRHQKGLQVEGVGVPIRNSVAWRKSLAFCLLCGADHPCSTNHSPPANLTGRRVGQTLYSLHPHWFRAFPPYWWEVSRSK